MYIEMSFVKSFDPTSVSHVMWLKRVDDAMVRAHSGKVDFMKIVNDNPFNASEKNPLNWAEIHFSLAMKYTQAVLRGTAFIPSSSNE